jgi:hypothetical protein
LSLFEIKRNFQANKSKRKLDIELLFVDGWNTQTKYIRYICSICFFHCHISRYSFSLVLTTSFHSHTNIHIFHRLCSSALSIHKTKLGMFVFSPLFNAYDGQHINAMKNCQSDSSFSDYIYLIELLSGTFLMDDYSLDYKILLDDITTSKLAVKLHLSLWWSNVNSSFSFAYLISLASFNNTSR